jgi:hypothetical protein
LEETDDDMRDADDENENETEDEMERESNKSPPTTAAAAATTTAVPMVLDAMDLDSKLSIPILSAVAASLSAGSFLSPSASLVAKVEDEGSGLIEEVVVPSVMSNTEMLSKTMRPSR